MLVSIFSVSLTVCEESRVQSTACNKARSIRSVPWRQFLTCRVNTRSAKSVPRGRSRLGAYQVSIAQAFCLVRRLCSSDS